jgi:hypothetical protein
VWWHHSLYVTNSHDSWISKNICYTGNMNYYYIKGGKYMVCSSIVYKVKWSHILTINKIGVLVNDVEVKCMDRLFILLKAIRQIYFRNLIIFLTRYSGDGHSSKLDGAGLTGVILFYVTSFVYFQFPWWYQLPEIKEKSTGFTSSCVISSYRY